ncbi:hypothetical protein CLOM_g20814 [Closterium sp. NIES-68]|nr:hypothetical protein CLOM_g20814 [Closterium sp. NIES-68]GJP73751.1 hypothetical protein CLOP_g4438 [Closterium sp. NIES-67]
MAPTPAAAAHAALDFSARTPTALPASPSASATSSFGRIASRASLFAAAPAADALDMSRPSVLLGAADCCRPLPVDCDYSGASSSVGAKTHEGSGSNFDESDMFSDLPAERLCFAERLSQESKIGGSRGTKRTAEDLAERRVRGKSEKMGANNGDAAVLDSDDCAESLPLWSGATCWGESEAAAKHLRGASDGRSPSTSLPWWVLEALGEDEEGEGEVDGVAPTPASPADSACSAAAGGDYSRGSSVGGDPAEVESSLAGESVRGGDLICAEYAQSFLAVVPPSALSGACVGAWEEPLGAEDIGALLQAELCGDAFTARSVVGDGEGSADAEKTLDALCADDVLRAHCFADEAETGGKLEGVEAEGEMQQWELGGLGMWCWEGRLMAC